MTHYPFTAQRALDFIASASTPVSKTDMLAFFKPDDKLETRIDKVLKKLCDQGLITQESGRKKYSAKSPYADIAYATLTDRTKGKKRYVEIWGRPKGSEYRATLSEKQIHQNKLEAGDTIVINITTGKGLERSANFLKKCEEGYPAHIQGYFNAHSNDKPTFEAANRNIKTQFRLQNSAPDFETEHRGLYDALLPLDMRIDDPQIFLIEDNGIDLDTGADINTVLLKKHGVPHQFSNTAVVEAGTLEKRGFTKTNRSDKTDRDFITVDPDGAEDLDDAACVEKLDGGWRLTVAIADIDEFVSEGSTLDKESYEKGTTFYLPERNYPLYPHDLTMRCSLLQNQERPAGIYEAYFDEDMTLQSESTGLGIIRTRAQLTYDQYQELLDQGDKRIRLFDEFHQRLREKFWEAQSGRNLANQVLRNQDSGYISHGFVETAMVIANEGIARELHEAGLAVPFRNHGPMVQPEAYKKMAQELNYLGFEISDSPYDCDWATLDNILQQAEQRGIKSRVEEVLSSDFFDRSYYEPSSRGHFALGIQHYCHATSPLRRKPDSYIWRGIRRLHGIKKGALSDAEIERMPEICDHLQTANRIAKDIESDRNKWRLIKTLKGGDERRATILHVNKDSVEIMLSNGLRNRLSDEMLKAGGWDIDADNRQIVRISNGEEERLGRDQHLRGKIESVKPLQALWKFVPCQTPDHTYDADGPDISPQ